MKKCHCLIIGLLEKYCRKSNRHISGPSIFSLVSSIDSIPAANVCVSCMKPNDDYYPIMTCERNWIGHRGKNQIVLWFLQTTTLSIDTIYQLI